MGKILEFKKKDVTKNEIKTEIMVYKDDMLCKILTALVDEHMTLNPTMPDITIERIKYIVDKVYNHIVVRYNREMR